MLEGEDEDEYPEPKSMLTDDELCQVLQLAVDKELDKEEAGVLLLLEDMEGCLSSERSELPLNRIFEQPIMGFRNEVTTAQEILNGQPPRILYQWKAEGKRDDKVVAAYYVEIWRG